MWDGIVCEDRGVVNVDLVWLYGVPNVMITMHVIRNAKTALEAQQLMLSLPSAEGLVGGSWADIYGTQPS